MAKQIAGPNLGMIKSGVGNLSTNDLINNKDGVVYYVGNNLHYVNPIYYTPYLGAESYAEILGNVADSPFTPLYSVAYATSLISQSGVDLGVDYSDYSNFVHFGSAQERLEHFKDKLESIHYHASKSLAIQTTQNATPTYQSQSIDFHINSAAAIIGEFDGYDRYLYFQTGSTTWPKDSNGALYEINTTPAINWFVTQSVVAEDFDLQNQNRLINTLPDYIREDAVNNPALVFCDMIGQHYDNLLLYADGIAKKHDADNRLNIGISRDLVADTLKGFGIQLYESQLKNTDLVRLYAGSFYPTGSEQITTMVSASNAIPSVKDQIDGTNKRIYHNLAHLLQTKGTKRGLRALINAFGIPNNNLLIKEFGGINKGDGQNFGNAEVITDSLGKVRLDNTGSYVSGSTLASNALTYKGDTKYTQDLHVVEVGWSTNQQKDNFITGSLSATFNIDDYIGDPRQKYNSSYSDLTALTNTVLSGSQDNTLYDFLRLFRYFDNQVFSMLQDFVPARTSLRRGAIIKPHILERSKMGVGYMSQSLHQISSSIDMYTVSGGFSETWNNHDTTYTELRPTALGYVSESIDDQRAKYDGELGGSTIEASNGEMNPNNPLKRTSYNIFRFDTTKFTSQGDFLNTPLSLGDLFLYYYDPMNPGDLGVGYELPFGAGGPYNLIIQYQNTNSDVDGQSLYVKRNDVLLHSTTQPSSITLSNAIYEYDELKFYLAAYDMDLPYATVDVEISYGATTISDSGTSSASINNASSPLTVGTSNVTVTFTIS